MTQTTNLDLLKAIRDYRVALDDNSDDAKLLTWAVGEIERLTMEEAEIYGNGFRDERGLPDA